MKFAFLILGNNFDSKKDRAVIHNGTARIIGVPNIQEAAGTYLEEAGHCEGAAAANGPGTV